MLNNTTSKIEKNFSLINIQELKFLVIMLSFYEKNKEQ